MALMKIRLELARTTEFPDGNPNHGYEFVAPLDAQGHFVAADWPASRQLCTMRQFAPNADDVQGQLIHRRDGAWAFSYEPGESDDEPIFRFRDHRFRQGEYVSITEHDGQTRPFRVVLIEALHVAPKSGGKPAPPRR